MQELKLHLRGCLSLEKFGGDEILEKAAKKLRV